MRIKTGGEQIFTYHIVVDLDIQSVLLNPIPSVAKIEGFIIHASRADEHLGITRRLRNSIIQPSKVSGIFGLDDELNFVE